MSLSHLPPEVIPKKTPTFSSDDAFRNDFGDGVFCRAFFFSKNPIKSTQLLVCSTRCLEALKVSLRSQSRSKDDI